MSFDSNQNGKFGRPGPACGRTGRPQLFVRASKRIEHIVGMEELLAQNVQLKAELQKLKAQLNTTAPAPAVPIVNEPIVASGKYDPGLQDAFGLHKSELDTVGEEEMQNLVCVPNDPAGAYPVVSEYADHPAVEEVCYSDDSPCTAHLTLAHAHN